MGVVRPNSKSPRKRSFQAKMADLVQLNGDLPNKRRRSDDMNTVTVVLGAQWGDEGKGKIVDLLATDADVVCRCQVCRCVLAPCRTALGMLGRA